MDICGGPVTTVVWPPSFGHHRLATGNLKRGTIDAQALALAFPLIVLQPEHGVSGHESSAGTKSAIAELNRFKGTWEKQFTIYKS